MIHKRNAFTVYIEDMAYTFMKPLSGEHEGKLLKIYEDAYGDMQSEYMPIHEIIKVYGLIVEDINKVIQDLDEAYEKK